MTETHTISGVLKNMRALRDEREVLNDRDREIGTQLQSLERELLQYHEATGLLKIAGDGMSVSFDPDALRAKYEPEKWKEVVAWAVASGNEHIIQRRLTDSKVVDLIASGIPLPDGLSVETYTKMNIRRV